MKALMTAAVLMGLMAAQDPQVPPDPKALYEAGRYQQVLDAVASQADQASPDVIYLAAQSALHLSQPDAARAQFARLADDPSAEVPTAWSLVGQSAIALLDSRADLAIESGRLAVEQAPMQFHPHYQLGLAYSAAQQWQPAADAFEQAATIDPTFAYAHYYAGLAYSNVQQVSRMATHFEYFLKLAPEAPERSAVVTLMRRVR